MTEPITITTASPHGFERGMVLVLNGRKSYRILAVTSATTILVDRPWWMPLAEVWGFVRRPFEWVRYRLRGLWWSVLDRVDRDS
jgi:hypothetical protein